MSKRSLAERLAAEGIPEDQADTILLIQPHISEIADSLRESLKSRMSDICYEAEVLGLNPTDAVASFYGSILQTLNGVILDPMARIAKSYVIEGAPAVPKELEKLPPLMASDILPTALGNVISEVFRDVAGDELYHDVVEIMAAKAQLAMVEEANEPVKH